MNDIFISVFGLSLTFSILYIIILICKPLTYRYLTAVNQYYLRVFLLIFLFVPLNFLSLNNNSDIKIDNADKNIIDDNLINNKELNYQDNNDFNFYASSLPQETKEKHTNKNFIIIISNFKYIWLLGIIVFYIWKVVGYMRVIQVVTKSELIKDISNEEYKNTKVVFLKNDFFKTPILFGVFKPCIILPDLKLSSQELSVIIKHEMIHYHRKDILFKLIIILLNGIHWFNPLVYYFNNEISRYCEISCDEKVTSNMNNNDRIFYGLTLLNIIDNSCNNSPNKIYYSFSNSIKNLKERLIYIKMNKKNKKLSKCLLFLSILFSLLLVGSINKPIKVYINYIYAEVNKDYLSENKAFSKINPENIKSSLNIDDYNYNIIVTDINTGNILLSSGDINKQYIPNSSFKAISSAILIDSGIIRKDEIITEKNNYITCPIHKNKEIKETFNEAIINNCTSAILEKMNEIDNNKYLTYLDLLGFENIDVKNDFSGIGNGFYVTPLKMSEAYSIIATHKSNIITEETSLEVISLLNNYIKYGLYNDTILNKNIAGMFGINYNKSTEKYSYNFAGIAPADNPKYCIVAEYETDTYLENDNKIFASNIEKIFNSVLN